MSHAVVLVLVPATAVDVEAEVTRLMAPFDENGEWNRKGAKWDWWQIGGRWTGALDGYDPATDPRNIETCDLCGGSGTRPGGLNNGCNGCQGTGKRTTWPTNWEPHPGDVQPVGAALTAGFVPHAVLTPDGKWHEVAELGWFGLDRGPRKEEPDWKAEVAKLLAPYATPKFRAVVVDYHV